MSAAAARRLTARLAALLAALLLGAGAAPAPASWGPIRQVDGAGPRKLLVKGKPVTYFRVAKRAPIHFTLRGPARLVVISRAELREGSTGSFPYFIRVLGPHAPLKVRAMESAPASDATFPDSTHAILCESRRLVVPIPAGEQHVWISVSGVPGVFVRLLREPPGTNPDGMAAVEPAGAPRAVLVQERAGRFPYYTVTRGRPLLFRVAGPTPFELTSRLDFAKNDSGPTPYLLLVSNGEKTLRSLQYTAVPSDSATYPEVPDRVPSRGDVSEIAVGPGAAEIRVELVEPAGGAVRVRVRIGEKPEGGDE